MDVPLSSLGREQAAAFGAWLGSEPEGRRPQVMISSPYARAVETAEVIVASASLAKVEVRRDERLRERELGVLDLLTRRGVEVQFPLEAERRLRLGKFYHRPPGGESWVDVALRLRSWRDSVAREHDRERVMVVSHEVVIVMMRYLIEDLDEEQALSLARDEPLANCSLTSFRAGQDGRLGLERAGWTVPLARSDAAITADHDERAAPRALRWRGRPTVRRSRSRRRSSARGRFRSIRPGTSCHAGPSWWSAARSARRARSSSAGWPPSAWGQVVCSWRPSRRCRRRWRSRSPRRWSNRSRSSRAAPSRRPARSTCSATGSAPRTPCCSARGWKTSTPRSRCWPESSTT